MNVVFTVLSSIPLMLYSGKCALPRDIFKDLCVDLLLPWACLGVKRSEWVDGLTARQASHVACVSELETSCIEDYFYFYFLFLKVLK